MTHQQIVNLSVKQCGDHWTTKPGRLLQTLKQSARVRGVFNESIPCRFRVEYIKDGTRYQGMVAGTPSEAMTIAIGRGCTGANIVSAACIARL